MSTRFLTPTVVDHLLKKYLAMEFKRELVQIPLAKTSGKAFGKERRVTMSVKQDGGSNFAKRLADCREALEVTSESNRVGCL